MCAASCRAGIVVHGYAALAAFGNGLCCLDDFEVADGVGTREWDGLVREDRVRLGQRLVFVEGSEIVAAGSVCAPDAAFSGDGGVREVDSRVTHGGVRCYGLTVHHDGRCMRVVQSMK